jgi:hypothetical protein
MEVSHTEASKAADAELNASLDAGAEETAPADTVKEREMEVSHTEASKAADAELNASLDAGAEETAPADTVDKRRARRISDLAAESLQHHDSFQACLGASVAGILAIDQSLQERVTRALAADSGELADVSTVLPAIDTILRLERQVERFGQLTTKLQCMDQKIQADKSKLQTKALEGFVNQVTRKKPGLPPHW